MREENFFKLQLSQCHYSLFKIHGGPLICDSQKLCVLK